ncbi:hypothetical protein AC579_4146 [Pseudocercospora musae]|uniref:Chaperone/heat shock protein Hsp12 n=1 Tax=Pseudocercospora musae TaxID=113226 RepID=A0A139I222_9PEZI|nr:hypothetical protein AC579_4146 [Pseudocercospora musae]
MTDAGRKDLSDKIGDKVTPDNSKSTTGKVGDTITGVGDKVQRDVVPDSQKSTSQSVQDKASREKDAHKDESFLDKTKEKLGLGKH